MRKKVYILFCLLCPAAAGAQSDSANVYINILDIWGLVLKSGDFQCDFYTMMGSSRASDIHFYYMNGKVDTLATLLNGNHYEEWCKGEFRTGISFDNYPLDKQYLEIALEPGISYDSMVLYSTAPQNFLLGGHHLTGWKTLGVTYEVSKKQYPHYDVHGINTESKYSRITFNIAIERENKWMYLVKLYLPSFISMLILFVGFLLSAEHLETRFGLGVAAVFGVISSVILIQQNLPELVGFTLIEKMNYISLLVVFITLIIFCVSYTRQQKGKPVRWLETGSVIIISLVYLLSNLLLLQQAL